MMIIRGLLMRVLMLILLLLLIAPGLVMAQRSRAQSSSMPAVTAIEIHANSPFLPLSINGSDTCWFILDTGAPYTLINEKNAQTLGLKLSRPVDIHGEGEASIAASVTKNIRLNVAGINCPIDTALVTDLTRIETYLGLKVDGILGNDFIKQFVIKIDYQARELELHKISEFRYRGNGEILPIRFIDNLPHIIASIGRPDGRAFPGLLLVDTGNSGSLSLTKKFVANNSILASRQKMIDTIGGGVAGEIKEFLTRIASLQLGKYQIEDIVTSFPQYGEKVDETERVNGNLGSKILRRFNLIIDYQHRRLILEARENFAAPFSHDKSGLFITAEGAKFNIFKIHYVFEHSPASEAALMKDDEIISIDNRAADEFTLEELEALFEQDGREIFITVKRGERVIEAKLKLRRLI